MSFLATLVLAASIQSAAPIAAPVAPADYAQAAMTRQLAAQATTVRRQAVRGALDSSSRQFARSLQEQLAATRIRPAHETRRRALLRSARAFLDREVAQNEQTLRRQAISSALTEVTNSARQTLVIERRTVSTGKVADVHVVATQPVTIR